MFIHQPAALPQTSYPFLRAWHRFLGSADPDTQQQLNRAFATQAPPDAIYQIRGTGEWATAGSIRSHILREQIITVARRIAGRRRLRPTEVRARCDTLARRGTGHGMCDRILDDLGQCDRAADHLPRLP